MKLWLESAEERLRQCAVRLEEALPVSCRLWSHSLGECTAYDGYGLGLECSRAGQPETLSFEIQLSSLKINPIVEKFELAWDHEQARRFKTPVRRPQRLTPRLREQLDEFLSRLGAKMQSALTGEIRLGSDCLSVNVTLTKEEEVQPEAPEAEGGELEIVEAVHQQLFGPLQGEPLILSAWLASPPACLLNGVRQAFPDLSPQTLEDFQNRSQQPACFPEGFTLGDRPTVLDNEELAWEVGTPAFYSQYPRTSGYYQFSRPGLNISRDQALILATRTDGLSSAARPNNDPLLSSYFSQLCLLQKAAHGWTIRARRDWSELADLSRMKAFLKEKSLRRLSLELTRAGWQVEHPHPEQLHLTKANGSRVTVVSEQFLMDRLTCAWGESPLQEFYICPDPLLVVPCLCAETILERLR